MTNYIEYLGLPTFLGVCIVAILLIMNLIGEILEFKGKIVPEWMKVRKYFQRKKEERQTLQELPRTIEELRQDQQRLNEVTSVLEEVKLLLGDVNAHYSADNLAKRDSWMKWVNDRADVYDGSIVDFTEKLADVMQTLKDNIQITEEIFVQSSRDRVIDFAEKVGDENTIASREQFDRIFKVYERYEKFLEERDLTNGEIDVAIRIIREAYESRLRKHSFIENMRGYE